MVEDYSIVEKLIIKEIKRRGYTSFTEKECNIMYNDIKVNYEISDINFWEGIKNLVNNNILLFKISDSGISYYKINE